MRKFPPNIVAIADQFSRLPRDCDLNLFKYELFNIDSDLASISAYASRLRRLQRDGESSTMILEEYKEIVGTCAMFTTMGQMLAGTLICKDMYYKSSSRGVDPMPFLGTVGLCILMLRYALMLSDPVMINVNVFGFVTNTIYMMVYYYYSTNTKHVLKLIGKIAIFVTVLLAYAQIEHPRNVEFRFGLVVTVLLLLLIATPLVHLRDIIKTKNTDILPFPLIFMNTLVSFQWLLYGVIIDNSFIIFQNIVGFILSIAQLSLFIIFPSKKLQNELVSEQRKED